MRPKDCVSGVRWLALVLAVWLPGLHAAEVYKSIDAEGHVVYSDRAPTPTAQKSVIAVDQPDPAEVARLAKEQQIQKAQDLQRNRQKAADDKKKGQQEHEQQVQCDNARNRYYAAKDARRLFQRDADGNKVFYTDKEADAKREDARLAMTAACAE
jgi:hypothetical protein